MKTSEKNDKLIGAAMEFFKVNLYILKVLYSKNLDILQTFGSSAITLKNNDELNYYYLSVNKMIDNILNQEAFKILFKKAKPRQFETLIGEHDYYDVEWREWRPQALEFLAEIEKACFELEIKPLDLPENFALLIKETDKAIFRHNKICEREWEKQLNPSSESECNENELTLKVEFNNREREIKINGIAISKPDYGRANYDLFTLLYENAGKTFTKNEILDLKIKNKSFNAFINEINMKGVFRKYLFDVSKGKIRLNIEAKITNKRDLIEAKKQLEHARTFRKK